MNLYMIFRRSGWDPSELEAADARSNTEAGKRDDVRKIRSYVLDEPDGRVGTLCLYQATDPEALLEHARAADLPCDEVVRVTAIDVMRKDPELSAS
ncbi:nickel-binding protein [Phytoactinopolyspora mesophila]|uniref:DUF4242 domain-containing protein n=1 Tax=Phytoactinopolyspora mesophila TaxID=2650750 RepID=A0A7K3MCD2_9ACTN|nr:nickel-binding protein [Phytoactinopolyspora mesophila]NDL60840.1 DUF4242 domain-containing protein [Phytoactinopolyspora mesophila]